MEDVSASVHSRNPVMIPHVLRIYLMMHATLFLCFKYVLGTSYLCLMFSVMCFTEASNWAMNNMNNYLQIILNGKCRNRKCICFADCYFEYDCFPDYKIFLFLQLLVWAIMMYIIIGFIFYGSNDFGYHSTFIS